MTNKKLKYITILSVILLALTSLAVVAFASSERLYHSNTPNGTFVYREIGCEF